MGAVYLATHLALNKTVAIKEILSSSPASLRQFESEATILASLAHPNLPNIMDFFVEPNGSRYLVMEFVEGKNLEQIVAKRGRLRKETALRWMTQVFDAVEYIHANGIIHRDIKPQNIIITPQDQAVLVDFGISKVLASGQSTLTGARAGTAGYAPPEQYRGGTDERSDVYALGATLYFLLTGQVPQSALPRAAGATLTPPRQLNPAIVPEIETVILTAMSLAANQRYGSVSEMKRLLPTETPVVVRGQPRSLPVALLAVAGLVLVMLVLMVFSFIRPSSSEQTGGAPVATFLTAVSSPTVAQVALALPSDTPTAIPSPSPTITPIPPTLSPSPSPTPVLRLDPVMGKDSYPSYSTKSLHLPWGTPVAPFTRDVTIAVDVTNLASGSRSRLFERLSDRYGSITSAVWTLDGNQVLVTLGYQGTFVRDADQEYHFENPFSSITRMNRDGSNAKDLATASTRWIPPVQIDYRYFYGAIWSPDEQMIAVQYTIPVDGVNPRGGDQCPVIVNKDGAGMRKLEDCRAGDYPRYWSTDGKYVLVWSQSGQAGRRLWAYAVEGKERVSLATLLERGVKFYNQRYYPWRIVDQPKCDENT
jgi:serine/threonine-protein kinase